MKRAPEIARPTTPLPIDRLIRPFQEFSSREASSGLLLMAVTAIALLWANSRWSDAYFALWELPIAISVGEFVLSETALHWINDGLMAMFFFVIGLEVKREIMVGELASRRKAALPVLAAVGGMLFPAALYLLVNAGGVGQRGWGIPMATDIAFTLGILALLGNRISLQLRVFVTAAAIVDDIGAILVIALFYTTDVSWIALAIGAAGLLAMVAANWLGVKHWLPYGILGLIVWLAFLQSGVHATIAGVLAAMTIPAKGRIEPEELIDRSRTIVGQLEKACQVGGDILSNEDQFAAVQALETVVIRTESPLQRLEQTLHPWVTFLVVPLFAFANAGVDLRASGTAALTHPVSLGILAGLFVGKQVGVVLLSYVAVKSRIADLPKGSTWGQVYGVGILMGIGFTMSLFVANLSFIRPELLDIAKVGILVASVISGVVGYIILRLTCPANARATG